MKRGKARISSRSTYRVIIDKVIRLMKMIASGKEMTPFLKIKKIDNLRKNLVAVILTLGIIKK